LILAHAVCSRACRRYCPPVLPRLSAGAALARWSSHARLSALLRALAGDPACTHRSSHVLGAACARSRHHARPLAPRSRASRRLHAPEQPCALARAAALVRAATCAHRRPRMRSPEQPYPFVRAVALASCCHCVGLLAPPGIACACPGRRARRSPQALACTAAHVFTCISSVQERTG
jgi:hypothetical protein